MTIDDFKSTLSHNEPPNVAKALVALWHDARGEWDTAHGVAQDIEDQTGAWVHAYLHRKEGDANNAAYWYRRAGEPVATGPIEDEWDRIARALLDREGR
jgi:hypothetical protein